jgi:hypothetical protein
MQRDLTGLQLILRSKDNWIEQSQKRGKPLRVSMGTPIPSQKRNGPSERRKPSIRPHLSGVLHLLVILPRSTPLKKALDDRKKTVIDTQKQIATLSARIGTLNTSYLVVFHAKGCGHL